MSRLPAVRKQAEKYSSSTAILPVQKCHGQPIAPRRGGGRYFFLDGRRITSPATMKLPWPM